MCKKINGLSLLKEFFLSKNFTLGSVCAAMGMLMIYAFIENPFENTISHIGLEYPMLFKILCLTLCSSTGANQLCLFEKIEKNISNATLFKFAIVIVNAAMVVASFTSTENTTVAESVIHWTSALLFMGVNPILILYAAIFKLRKKSGRYIAVMCVFAAAYFADIIYILTVFISTASLSGKNGIMEITPIFLTYFLLLIFNHSALLENEESRLHAKEYGRKKYAVN